MNLTKDNWIQEVLHKELIPTANTNHDYNFNDIEVNHEISRFINKIKIITSFLPMTYTSRILFSGKELMKI